MAALQPETKPIQFPITTARTDPSHNMMAVEWHGNKDVRIVQRPRPVITEPKDAVIKVTATTLCGSDLHLYHNEFAGMKSGDILGHEFMGIIEAVGDQVSKFKVGDRVVVSFLIACGTCWYCQHQLFSCCDTTNPSKEMEEAYGHRIAGIFGYSHLTGGYEGGQAEYVRVPYADVNCLKVPMSLPDEKCLLLSDILCTSWHANELGNVSKGQTVAVWGCGPVGLLTLAWAKFRGAKRIIAIDVCNNRLELARKNLGVEVINGKETDTLKTLQTLVPGGPDVCIDAAGFRYSKEIAHKIQRFLQLETDTPEILREIIMAVRKGGKVSIVGDYYQTANGFPIGAIMEKSLHLSAGQTHVQKYWEKLLEYLEKGEIDPSFIITHTMPLEKAVDAYRMFDEKKDEVVKIILKPPSYVA